jgi:Skp family chaperone for outer membrane proteins
MKITLADKFIAYLALFSGLTISAVAIWYSVAGLVSIFAAAVTPIIVMGVALEISKLIATVWLKLNWSRAPTFIKGYLLAAIAILMIITSMGIFGFLSKAHSDQSLVSGDVQSKIAVYDEKIKTAKENIEANRKQLKQMDEAVDQVMGRSTDEKGADKANAIRKSQQRDRSALAKGIEANQKLIATLNDEAAPIRAEVRKVEAEVGPIKYIAAFIYGDNPDANVLEKAVTWVIIIIVSVFDPLAVILLLASQYSFQWFRKDREEAENTPDPYVADVTIPEPSNLPPNWPFPEPGYEPDDGPLTEEQVEQLAESVKDESLTDEPIPCHKCGTELIDAPGIGLFCPNKECDVIDNLINDQELNTSIEERIATGESYIDGDGNEVIVDSKFKIIPELQQELEKKEDPLEQWNKMIEAAEEQVSKDLELEKTPEEILNEGLNTRLEELDKKIQNDQEELEREKQLLRKMKSEEEDQDLKKKTTYIMKARGQQVTKTREE